MQPLADSESPDVDDPQSLDGLPRNWPQQSFPRADASLPSSPTPRAAPTIDPFASLHPDTEPTSLPPPSLSSFPADKPSTDSASYPEHFDHPTDLVAERSPCPPPSSHTVSSLDDPGINDLGWKRDGLNPPFLIRGITNDHLFLLIRRFNKQVQHVRAIPPPPPGVLDFDISEDEEFSPDKLRANLERFYLTIVVGLAALWKHIARLRSWNEPRRTAGFCAAYFFAWYISLLPALLLITLFVIMFHPPARRALFPPAPLAAVSATSGNLQIPRAGVLASHGSLSGAPEAHQGEAVEQEASQFVASVAAIGAGTVMGQGGAPKRKHGEARADIKHDAEGEMETEIEQNSGMRDDSFAGALPDPTDFALQAKDVKDTANSNGVEDPGAHVAKKSVEGAVWETMRPFMRILADVEDVWEQFAFALQPVPPFPKWTARIRLGSVLLPLLLAAFFVPASMVIHGATFLIGVLLFAQPILSKLSFRLNHNFPNWRERIALRRTILKGVPTNAQLTITLLRIAEEAKAPLPPPPLPQPHHTAEKAKEARPGRVHPPQAADNLKEHDLPFDADNYEIEGVDPGHPLAHTDEESSEEGTYVEDNGSDKESVEGEADNHKKRKKRKHGSKFVGFIRKTTRAGVDGILGVDHLKARVGNEHSKRRLGAVAPRAGELPQDISEQGGEPEEARAQLDEEPLNEETAEEAMRREGPTSFSARVNGKKGRVLLVSNAVSPCLSFVPEKPLRAALTAPSRVPGKGGDAVDGISAEFSIALGDVVAVRKMGGFGWKGRLVVGWATGRNVLDGLEIMDRSGGRRVITAITGRDELFNRMIAVGGQKWECL